MQSLKIDIISDLHIDFYIKETTTQNIVRFCQQIIPYDPGEILIIAGDTSHYNSQIKELLKFLLGIYKGIFIVSGNHDMYMLSKNNKANYSANSHNRLKELREICEEIGVFYLDGNVVDYKGVRIGGTGGWYNLPTDNDVKLWAQSLNDANYIREGNPFEKFDTQRFYESELLKLKEIAAQQCDILVTHVAQVIPPQEAIPRIFWNDPSNIFYYVDNFDLVKQSNCEYHIYGHTHDFQNYTINDVEMICNPYGYPSESKGRSAYQMEYFVS